MTLQRITFEVPGRPVPWHRPDNKAGGGRLKHPLDVECQKCMGWAFLEAKEGRPWPKKGIFKMEILEHFAKISLITKLLGKQTLLSREEVDKLFDVRGKYGINSPDFRESGCPVTASGEPQISLTRGELEELIKKAVSELSQNK